MLKLFGCQIILVLFLRNEHIIVQINGLLWLDANDPVIGGDMQMTSCSSQTTSLSKHSFSPNLAIIAKLDDII